MGYLIWREGNELLKVATYKIAEDNKCPVSGAGNFFDLKLKSSESEDRILPE
jgi:hypothetical protein